MDAYVSDMRIQGHHGDRRLRQSLLMSRLTEDQFKGIRKSSNTIAFRQGETIFQRGVKAHHLYFVLTGMVKLFRESENGQEKIYDFIESGEIVGDAAIFDEQQIYPYSSIAVIDSTVIAIKAQTFREIIKASPDALLFTMNYVCKRIHKYIDEVEQLSLSTGRGRVASYIYNLDIEEGKFFTFKHRKKEIASILGLKPETFSRTLKQLCSKDIIEIKDNKIKIVDMARLREQSCC